ncbi:MAG TPA: DUF3293 domain-containing protein [Solimonas sp.]|nr:DUF3293 domain-containing protein [Solimonas sp.]
MTPDPALLAAFSAASYCVQIGRRWHSVRVGQPCPRLDRRLAAAGCQQHWHFITAWNPDAVPRERPANERDQRDLGDQLAAQGWRCLEAVARDHAGHWQEPGAWVLDGDEALLVTLGRHYRQRALLRGDRGGIPTLLWLA